VLRALVRTAPPLADDGVTVARWTLKRLRGAVTALADYSISGLSRLVQRAGLRQKRGRMYLHSPDPDYETKAVAVAQALAQARQHPQTVTLLYQDEAGICRQPSLAPFWAPVGVEPTVSRSYHANHQHRICAALDAVTGQVHWWAGDHTTLAVLRQFLTDLRTSYGPSRRLIVVWDNWPVHRHADLLTIAATHHIEVLFLPTYAPWLNPIEKLWRWLKQEVVHGHRLAADWTALKASIAAFLKRFQAASPDLLRYTGLYDG
jgi:transposase